MIRPELHTFKWSPKTKSKEDLELVKDLEQLIKESNLTKTQVTRKALKAIIDYGFPETSSRHLFYSRKLT